MNYQRAPRLSLPPSRPPSTFRLLPPFGEFVANFLRINLVGRFHLSFASCFVLVLVLSATSLEICVLARAADVTLGSTIVVLGYFHANGKVYRWAFPAGGAGFDSSLDLLLRLVPSSGIGFEFVSMRQMTKNLAGVVILTIGGRPNLSKGRASINALCFSFISRRTSSPPSRSSSSKF